MRTTFCGDTVKNNKKSLLKHLIYERLCGISNLGETIDNYEVGKRTFGNRIKFQPNIRRWKGTRIVLRKKIGPNQETGERNSMKIIEDIYYGRTNEAEGKRASTAFDDAERAAYEKLWDSLSEEQLALFETFYEAHLGRMGELRYQSYEKGFKTGARLGLELKDSKPE